MSEALNHNAFKGRLTSSFRLVNRFQNKYKTSVKKKAERQILAVKPTATEEELTAVFEQEVRKDGKVDIFVLIPVSAAGFCSWIGSKFCFCVM